MKNENQGEVVKKQIGDLTVYDVEGVAEALDLTPYKIREYIRQGRIKANKIGKRYWVTEDDLKTFVRGDMVI